MLSFQVFHNFAKYLNAVTTWVRFFSKINFIFIGFFSKINFIFIWNKAFSDDTPTNKNHSNTCKSLQKLWQFQNTSYYKKPVVAGFPYVLWNSPQLLSFPLQIRDTGIITIAEHSIASKRSLQLWSIPPPNQIMESWFMPNSAKPNQTKPSQDKAGKGKPRPIWPYPCFSGAIFLKFQALQLPGMRYKGYEFGCIFQ